MINYYLSGRGSRWRYTCYVKCIILAPDSVCWSEFLFLNIYTLYTTCLYFETSTGKQ